MDIKVNTNNRMEGKKVGELINSVYYTNRLPNHFMKKFQGFGISEEVLEQLHALNCTHVRITYQGARGVKVYHCPLRYFLISIKEHYYEGGDLQKFVSIKDMEEYAQYKDVQETL